MLERALEIGRAVGTWMRYWSSALVLAVAARAAAHNGRMREARQLVRRAALLRPLLTHALPVISVQTLVELCRVYLELVDPSGARAVLEQAQDILRRRPDLGTLPVHAVARLQARVDQITVAEAFGASTLTTAELRLMPLLSTHLSVPQIAERLFVSPHTVKAQVKSIYRKLGVSSRADAVDRMADLTVQLGASEVTRAAPARWSPTLSALAIAVSAGLTAPMLGKKLVSTTYRLSTSCALQLVSRTEVSGSCPNRTVPAWCAHPATGMSFFM